ncbi:MAG: SpoIID/LytB domain-containing protein [Phycisphaerales bacterium]
MRGMTVPFRRSVQFGAAILGIALLAACDGFNNPFDPDPEPVASRPTSTTPAKTNTTVTTPGVGPELPLTVIPGIAGEPDMRIRIMNATTRIKVGVSGGTAVYAQAVGSGKAPARLTAPVTVDLSDGGWQLSDQTGLSAHFDRNGDVDFSADEKLTGAPGATVPPQPMYASGNLAIKARQAGLSGPMLTVNNAKYPGRLRLTARTETSPRAFDVVEHTGIEDYLRGVVAAEMLKNWPLEAYRVQAVAARSYAIHERGRARAAGQKFDVEASVMDQAYSGATEQPLPQQAVADTRGIVLTWSGGILRAYYSSCSGGRPASAKDVWPTWGIYEFNLAGPLQAQPREEWGQTSPWFRWTVARTQTDVQQRLRAWGREKKHSLASLGTLTTVTTASTNAAGRPNKYTITERSGATHTIGAEELRWALNIEVSSLVKIDKSIRVHSSDIEVLVTGDVVKINGRGFGHGVGMDQWATKELADKGQDWKTIVLKFYPGATVQRAY